MRPYTMKVGDRLPHNTRNFTEPHRIIDIHYDGPQVRVKTTEGSFVFRHDQKVRFPIRLNESYKIFIATDAPRPVDIAVDDLLPAPVPGSNIEDPRTTADWQYLDEDTRKDYLIDYEEQCIAEGEYQIVSAVTWPKPDLAQIEVVYAKTGLVDRVNVPSYDHIVFPLPTAKRAVEKQQYSPVERDYVKYGPYVSEETGRRVFLAAHPFGRGRWPQTIPVNSHNGEDGVTIRPPRGKGEWDMWRFDGEYDGEHPNDPSK